MPILETLILAVAPALSKIVLKVWAGDEKLLSEGGASLVETLAKIIPDLRAQKEANRQLEAIGEKAAESLRFTFETEGKALQLEDQEAVAKLVAQTLESSYSGHGGARRRTPLASPPCPFVFSVVAFWVLVLGFNLRCSSA